MGVHWKIRFLGDVFHEKPIYWGELSKKRGLGQFAALRGGEGWQKRAGEVFLRGVWCPNAHYVLIFNFKGNPEISSENNHSIKGCHKTLFYFWTCSNKSNISLAVGPLSAGCGGTE